MADEVQQFLKRVAETRLARATPAQRARRQKVNARNEAIAAGVRRGPNAPKDKTFGGVKKER
jgi:hypothetical protein